LWKRSELNRYLWSIVSMCRCLKFRTIHSRSRFGRFRFASLNCCPCRCDRSGCIRPGSTLSLLTPKISSYCFPFRGKTWHSAARRLCLTRRNLDASSPRLCLSAGRNFYSVSAAIRRDYRFALRNWRRWPNPTSLRRCSSNNRKPSERKLVNRVIGLTFWKSGSAS